MACCEKCWSDAGGDPDRYRKLSVERADNPCTPEQHAGHGAAWCATCERWTVHQHARVCVVCQQQPGATAWHQPVAGTWQHGEGMDAIEITTDSAGWLIRLPGGNFRRLEGVVCSDDAGARRAAAFYVVEQGRRLVRIGEAALEDLHSSGPGSSSSGTS